MSVYLCTYINRGETIMNNQTAQFLATLPTKKAIIASKQIEDNSKKVSVAYLLLILPALFWVNGCHHFYLGRTDKGIVWLLSLGILGLGNIWDLFTIPSQVRAYNKKVEDDVIMMFLDEMEG